MRLLALSGSLRAASSNALLLQAAAALAPPGVGVAMYQGVGSLPHFNADIEERALPIAAAELRRIVAAADGLLISSPEYAHGIAGSFKNALDWLVASTEFAGMPVGIFNASLSATHAHAQLVEILATMSANVVANACVRVPVSRADASARDITKDPVRSEIIVRAMDVLIGTIASSPRR